MKAKGFENIFLLIELLKLVYYLDIFETLIGRSGSDRIILSNFGKHFLGERFKDVFLIFSKLLKIDLTGRTSNAMEVSTSVQTHPLAERFKTSGIRKNFYNFRKNL